MKEKTAKKDKISTFKDPAFEDLLRVARSTGSYSLLYEYSGENFPDRRRLIQSYNEKFHHRITSLVNQLYDLLELYGYEKGEPDSTKFLRHLAGYWKLNWSFNCYTWTYGENSWMEMFKWKITSFFSAIFKQEIPPEPRKGCIAFKNPMKLFYGRAQRYVHLYIKGKDLLSFAGDVLMNKKGCPPVSADLVLEKQIECYKQLTTAPDIKADEFQEKQRMPLTVKLPTTAIKMETIKPSRFDWEEIVVVREIKLNQTRLFDFIDKVIKETFGGKRLSEDILTSFAFPSLSSNYNMTRTEAGGLGQIMLELRGMRKELYAKAFEDDLLVDFFEDGVFEFVSIDDTYFYRHITQKECVFNSEEGDEYSREGFTFVFDTAELSSAYKWAFRRLIDIAVEELPETATVGLPEPLKVRVITKGPPVTYFVLKNLQKFLWKTLKSHPTFELIGTPLTEEIVNKIFVNLGLDDHILSGDYKASTDNIFSHISEYACRKLFETLGKKSGDNPYLQTFEDLCLRALTGHWIRNPYFDFLKGRISSIKDIMERARTGIKLGQYREQNKIDALYKLKKAYGLNSYQLAQEELARLELALSNTEEGKQQQMGQLMGSVVSFPFLCIINAAVCWWSMSIDNPINEFSLLADLKLRVNGDDCVFAGSSELERFWRMAIAYVGFSSSVGKTYFSRDLLVMNSMTFLPNEDRTWSLLKYVNFALLKAVGKDGEEHGNPFALSSIQKELKEKTPQHLWGAVNKMFYRNHSDKMKATGLPYYMPQWAGGLELLLPEEMPEEKTRMDRVRLAARMARGERFKPPPLEETWLIEKGMRRLMKDVIPLSETFSKTLTTRQRLVDLEDKEYYNPVLALLLLSMSSKSWPYQHEMKPEDFQGKTAFMTDSDDYVNVQCSTKAICYIPIGLETIFQGEYPCPFGKFCGMIKLYIEKMRAAWKINPDCSLRPKSLTDLFIPEDKKRLAFLTAE